MPTMSDPAAIDSFIARWENSGAAERANYQQFVRDGLMSDELTTKQKALILRESTMVLVEELFERPDIENALKDARQAVDEYFTASGHRPFMHPIDFSGRIFVKTR